MHVQAGIAQATAQMQNGMRLQDQGQCQEMPTELMTCG